MNLDRLIGIAYTANLFHSGQWSRGYRLLCRIQWSPKSQRAEKLLPREEYSEARNWAAHYIRRARKQSSLF